MTRDCEFQKYYYQYLRENPQETAERQYKNNVSFISSKRIRYNFVILMIEKLILTFKNRTLNESVSCHAFRTSAHWNVKYNFTNRIRCTYIGVAWVYAFLAVTGFVGRTVRTKNTLRSTFEVWVSSILGKASTFAVVATYSVCSTWRWIAGVNVFWWFCK